MSNPKLHESVIFVSVPLVLTFVNEPTATEYECQNQDTSLITICTQSVPQ